MRKGFAVAAKYVGIGLFILAFMALIGIGGPMFIGGFLSNPFDLKPVTSTETPATPSLPIPGLG